MTWTSVRMLATKAKQLRVIVTSFVSGIMGQRLVSAAVKCVEAYA